MCIRDSAETVAVVGELLLANKGPLGSCGLAGLGPTEDILAAIAGAGVRIYRY